MVEASSYSEYFGNMVRESFSKFLYAYSKEDLMREFEDLRREEGTSGYSNRRWRLVKHLRACGIECEKQASAEVLYEKVQQAPDRDALIRRLLLELDRLWREYPSPADHIRIRSGTLGIRICGILRCV